MRKTVIGVMALGTAVQVGAQDTPGKDWAMVGLSSAKDVYFYRQSEPQRDSKPTYWFWIDHSANPKTKARKTMQRIRFDCAERRMTILAFADYSADGAVLSSREFAYPESQLVIPSSVGEVLWNEICQPSAP